MAPLENVKCESSVKFGTEEGTLDVFKMAAAVILNFQNMDILGAGRIKTAKIRYCAKFRGLRSNHC